MRKNGKCQQPERPSETVRACAVSHSLLVCVSSCSWETVCWWDVAFLWNGQKKEARRQNYRKNRKTGRSWHVSRGVTWSTELIRAVKDREKKREKERWSKARQTQTWAHIPAPDYKIPTSCRRVETDYTHMHTHSHIGPHSPGNRCKLRHTCRNTNSLIDITDVHAHAHMLGREEIPEGTGGSGDSNLSGWLWSSPCLCHHCWNTLDGSGQFPINHYLHTHAKM